MIDKKSNEGMVCIYCGEPAIKDTDPPVCVHHKTLNKSASELDTLDSVSQDPGIWSKE